MDEIQRVFHGVEQSFPFCQARGNRCRQRAPRSVRRFRVDTFFYESLDILPYLEDVSHRVTGNMPSFYEGRAGTVG